MWTQGGGDRTPRRAVWALAGVAGLMIIAGCASTASPDPAQQDGDTVAVGENADPGEDTGDANDFCASTEGLGEALLVLADEESDPSDGKLAIKTAKKILTEVPAPEPIAMQWGFLLGATELFEQAYAEVDVEAGEKLQLDDEAFATVLFLPGGVETVGVYLQQECAIELGLIAPAITDVCAAVDTALLESIFSTVPTGESLRWGASTVECTWKTDDLAVGAVVGSESFVMDDVLQRAAPVDQVQTDGYTIDMHDGALGPVRVNTRGSTAVTVVGDWAVMASVASGDNATDAAKAVELVALLAAALP